MFHAVLLTLQFLGFAITPRLLHKTCLWLAIGPWYILRNICTLLNHFWCRISDFILCNLSVLVTNRLPLIETSNNLSNLVHFCWYSQKWWFCLKKIKSNMPYFTFFFNSLGCPAFFMKMYFSQMFPQLTDGITRKTYHSHAWWWASFWVRKMSAYWNYPRFEDHQIKLY